MKAAVIQQFGDPDVFRIEDVATPRPRAGNVLIKIDAAGVNRFDHYIREGSVVPELPFPHILGADAAGEIHEVGEGVEGFRIGAPAWRCTIWPGGSPPMRPASAAASRSTAGASSSLTG